MGLGLGPGERAGLARQAKKTDGLVHTLESEAATHGHRVTEARAGLARAERKRKDVEPSLMDKVRQLVALMPDARPLTLERLPTDLIEAAGLSSPVSGSADKPSEATNVPSRSLRPASS